MDSSSYPDGRLDLSDVQQSTGAVVQSRAELALVAKTFLLYQSPVQVDGFFCDVILAAHAQAFDDASAVVVATTNTKHLERYVDARLWSDIGRT
jgi:hypothetical protein